MVTYAQLQSESAYNREVTTPEMKAFGVRLCGALGVGTDAFGVKGNNVHLNGGHRSQRWIRDSRYCTNRTYTVESGLSDEESDYLSAFDITPKTRDQMLIISRNLDRVTRAGQLEDLVEWFGNTNNDTRVDGWDNIRNAVITSDSSHLWHLHGRAKRRKGVLRSADFWDRVFNALMNGTSTGGDDMQLSDASPWTTNFTGEEGLPAPWLAGNMGNQLQYVREDAHFSRLLARRTATEVTALRGVVEALAATITAGGGNVDTVAILAGVDERLEALAAEQRDAVADLGEGGAAKVRADAAEGSP